MSSFLKKSVAQIWPADKVFGFALHLQGRFFFCLCKHFNAMKLIYRSLHKWRSDLGREYEYARWPFWTMVEFDEAVLTGSRFGTCLNFTTFRWK